MNEDFEIIKYKYEQGTYSLEDVFWMTTLELISKDEFHKITGYNFEGLKKSRGW